MDALLKWMQTPEAKKIADAAEDEAWDNFQQQFPNADRSKFASRANFAKNHTASAEIFFKNSSGVSTGVFGSDRRYWSPQMKTALGLDDVNGFPYQLSPLKTKKCCQYLQWISPKQREASRKSSTPR